VRPFLSSDELEKLRKKYPVVDAAIKDRIAQLDEWYRRYRKLMGKLGAGLIVRPKGAA